MVRFLIFLAVLIVAGYGSYKYLTESSDASDPASFPMTRTLTDRDGRKIEAEILGIESGLVTLRRISDDRLFRFPLNRLSRRDRSFFSRYEDGASIDSGRDVGEIHVHNLRMKIGDLESDIETLKMKAEDPSGSFDGRNAEYYESRIEEVESRINALKVKIREFETRGSLTSGCNASGCRAP